MPHLLSEQRESVALWPVVPSLLSFVHEYFYSLSDWFDPVDVVFASAGTVIKSFSCYGREPR